MAPAVAMVCSGNDCDAIDSNAFDTYPYHWIGMEPIGMHTIGMDTCGFFAGVADAARSALIQQDLTLTAVRSVLGLTACPFMVRQTTVERAACAPLANTHSPRDNYVYRASFTRRNHPIIPPPETR